MTDVFNLLLSAFTPALALAPLSYWLWLLYFCTYSKRKKNVPVLISVGLVLTSGAISYFYWLTSTSNFHPEGFLGH